MTPRVLDSSRGARVQHGAPNGPYGNSPIQTYDNYILEEVMTNSSKTGHFVASTLNNNYMYNKADSFAHTAGKYRQHYYSFQAPNAPP